MSKAPTPMRMGDGMQVNSKMALYTVMPFSIVQMAAYSEQASLKMVNFSMLKIEPLKLHIRAKHPK